MHNRTSLSAEEKADLKRLEALFKQHPPLTDIQLTDILALAEKYHIHSFETTYGEAEIEEVVWRATPPLREKLLRVLIQKPQIGLRDLFNSDLHSHKVFCEQLKLQGMPPLALLTFIGDEQWYECLPWFADSHDIAKYIPLLSHDDRHKVLLALAPHPEYRQVIEEYADDQYRKIRELVADVVAGRYAATENKPLIELLNFGLFTERPEGQLTDPDDEDYLGRFDHRKETHMIDVSQLPLFGLELGYFREDDDREYPESVDLKVVLHHPYMKHFGGYITEWPVESTLGSRVFTCWHMAEPAYCIPGNYCFRVYDSEDTLLVEKNFHLVKPKPWLNAEVESLLADEDVRKKQVGSLNLTGGDLAFGNCIEQIRELTFGVKWPKPVNTVLSYTRDNKLEAVEIARSQDKVVHWYPASNQVFPYLEAKMKNKVLALGDGATLTQTFESETRWQDFASSQDPVRLIQPNDDRASNVVIAKFDKKRVRAYLGFSASGELNSVLLLNTKAGILRRIFLFLMHRIDRKVLVQEGIPATV